MRAVALLLTVLTGFSGLVYEVAWQKAFAILLGSHSEATAAVLGIFLGGLSLGYALFGGVSRRVVEAARRRGRPPRLLMVYGLVEAAIGVHALLFGWIFAAVRELSLALSPESQVPGFAVDVGLTALAIGPPTVLMGGTIPILTQALSRSLGDATRFHAFVYGFNAAGAVGGALAAGFVLIPRLGILGTLGWMGLVNLGAGAVFLVLGLRGRAAAPPREGAAAPRIQGFGAYALAAALLGFAMMAAQTVLIRIGGLAFGASHFTFAMVVAVFVLCIALGSLAVSALPRIPRAAPVACSAAMAALLLALYGSLPDAPYWAHLLRTQFPSEEAAFHRYWLSALGGILVVLALPVGLSGATLPLLFHHLRHEVADLGQIAGRLYSWNTVGNLLGALLGGYALLLWIDLHQVYRLAVAAAFLASGILAFRIHAPPRLALGAVGAALLAVLVGLDGWDPQRLSSGLFRKREASAATHRGAGATFAQAAPDAIPFYTDDPTASIAVKMNRIAGREVFSIITNGKPDSSLGGDYPTMALHALVPCLVAAQCRDAFVVGYGTGVTAGEFAALDSMRQVVVAEISRGVIQAAPYFDHGNQQASQSPKVRLRRRDAYRALLRSEGRFDVIASEPSNPWVTGVEMLYSREFLEAARDRLGPGGVYAQWLQSYEIDGPTVELVLRTYASVFDRVAVWYTVGPDLMLLGLTEGAEVSLDRIAERMQAPDFRAGLRRAGVRSLTELLAHELLPVGVLHAARMDGEVHTLLHPRLSDRAARAFFRGETANLPATATGAPADVGARTSLLRSHAIGPDGRLAPRARRALVDELCGGLRRECATVVARWMAEDPDSIELRALLQERRRNPRVARHLEPALLERLVRFFGEGSGGEARSAEAIEGDAALFETYYYHGVPFRRDALPAFREGCREPGCAAAIAAAEERPSAVGRSPADSIR